MKKQVSKKSKNSDTFGISGFTLGIAGFVALLLSPLLAILFFTTGLIFCIVQQKRKNTRLGKLGVILNSVGIVLTILYFIFLIKYLIPEMTKLYEQNFPAV